MSKIKKLKIKASDGSYTEVDLGANAANVDLTDGSTVESKISSINTTLGQKQNTLTAGSNITISGNTISATDTNTTYTAGNNVQISSSNVISATDTKYTAGDGIAISDDNVISTEGGTGGDYLPLTGGTMQGPINFTSASLPEKTLSYVVGIDAFADGGQLGWQRIGAAVITYQDKSFSGNTDTYGTTTYSLGTAPSVSGYTLLGACIVSYSCGSSQGGTCILGMANTNRYFVSMNTPGYGGSHSGKVRFFYYKNN